MRLYSLIQGKTEQEEYNEKRIAKLDTLNNLLMRVHKQKITIAMQDDGENHRFFEIKGSKEIYSRTFTVSHIFYPSKEFNKDDAMQLICAIDSICRYFENKEWMK